MTSSILNIIILCCSIMFAGCTQESCKPESTEIEIFQSAPSQNDLESARRAFDPFTHVMGISEDQFKRLTPDQKKSFLSDGYLINRQTKKRYAVGTYQAVPLGELRTQALAKSPQKPTRINVIEGFDAPWSSWFRQYVDWGALQAAPENQNAVFLVASNFNCLEAGGDPHEGIMPYLDPGYYVQGETAAVSAMPGIIYRLYYADPVNLLDDFSQKHPPLIPVHNGYIQRIPELDQFTTASSLQNQQTRDRIKIGLHFGTHVIGGLGPLKSDLPAYKAIAIDNEKQRINQVFAAAMNPYFNDPASRGYQSLAQMLLIAAYEGALMSAIVHQKHKIFLTLIGGGVFQNKLDWISAALKQAFEPFLENGGLEIYLVIYPSQSYDPAEWQKFKSEIDALVQKTGGTYLRYRKDGLYKIQFKEPA